MVSTCVSIYVATQLCTLSRLVMLLLTYVGSGLCLLADGSYNNEDALLVDELMQIRTVKKYLATVSSN